MKHNHSGLQPITTEAIKTLKEVGFIKGSIPTDSRDIASLWLIEQMNILSSCISYCNQPLVMDIRPSPGFEGSFFAGELRLFPHTDLAWYEDPPTFIGMFCINPGEKNECQTISDSCKVIASLPEHITTWLRANCIYFPSPRHIKTKGFTGNIIDGNIVRINSRDIRNNWPEEAEYFLQKLIDFEEKIYFKTGDFWFFDICTW